MELRDYNTEDDFRGLMARVLEGERRLNDLCVAHRCVEEDVKRLEEIRTRLVLEIQGMIFKKEG